MGAKISVLGLIMSFSPISEVCDGTVSLTSLIVTGEGLEEVGHLPRGSLDSLVSAALGCIGQGGRSQFITGDAC